MILEGSLVLESEKVNELLKVLRGGTRFCLKFLTKGAIMKMSLGSSVLLSSSIVWVYLYIYTYTIMFLYVILH